MADYVRRRYSLLSERLRISVLKNVFSPFPNIIRRVCPVHAIHQLYRGNFDTGIACTRPQKASVVIRAMLARRQLSVLSTQVDDNRTVLTKCYRPPTTLIDHPRRTHSLAYRTRCSYTQ